MQRLRVHPLSFVAGFAVAAVLAGGVAVTNAFTTNGPSVTACVNRSTGVMRHSPNGTCRRSERKVTWSQSGPQGPAGPAGAPGAAGSAGQNGERGPSDLYIREGGAGVGIDSFTNGYVAVATMTLPAGDYLLTGTGSVWGNDGEDLSVRCRLDVHPSDLPLVTLGVGTQPLVRIPATGNGTKSVGGPVHVQRAVVVTYPARLELQCLNYYDTPVLAEGGLSAIQVAAITTLTE